MQPLSRSLSPADMDLIRDCLRAAVEGPFFPEWEFETIMGVDRATMRAVLQAWPLQTVDDSTFDCALVGAMNNLTGYPHRKEKALVHYVPAGYDAICWALDRLVAVLRPGRKPVDPWVPLSQSLSAADIEVLREAMRLAVEGPLFAGEEFVAHFGMQRLQVELMLGNRMWQSLRDPNFAYAAGLSLSLLLERADGDAEGARGLAGGRDGLRATFERLVAAAPHWRAGREAMLRGLPLSDALDAADIAVVRDCLNAAVEGPFFPGEAFAQWFNLTRAQMRQKLVAWQQTVDDEFFGRLAWRVLHHLLHGRHGQEAALASWVPAGSDEVGDVLMRLGWADRDKADEDEEA